MTTALPGFLLYQLEQGYIGMQTFGRHGILMTSNVIGGNIRYFIKIKVIRLLNYSSIIHHR